MTIRFWHSTGVWVLSPHGFLGEAVKHIFYGWIHGYPDFYDGLHLKDGTYLDGIRYSSTVLLSPMLKSLRELTVRKRTNPCEIISSI